MLRQLLQVANETDAAYLKRAVAYAKSLETGEPVGGVDLSQALSIEEQACLDVCIKQAICREVEKIAAATYKNFGYREAFEDYRTVLIITALENFTKYDPNYSFSKFMEFRLQEASRKNHCENLGVKETYFRNKKSVDKALDALGNEYAVDPETIPDDLLIKFMKKNGERMSAKQILDVRYSAPVGYIQITEENAEAVEGCHCCDEPEIVSDIHELKEVLINAYNVLDEFEQFIFRINLDIEDYEEDVPYAKHCRNEQFICECMQHGIPEEVARDSARLAKKIENQNAAIKRKLFRVLDELGYCVDDFRGSMVRIVERMLDEGTFEDGE